MGVHDFKVNGEGIFRENRQQWYNKMVENMVKEIEKSKKQIDKTNLEIKYEYFMVT